MNDSMNRPAADGADTPQRIKKPARSTSWILMRNILILAVVGYFVKNGISDFWGPKKVMDILETRYRTEFEFKGWKNSGMTMTSPRTCEVTPKNEPDNIVTVRVFPGNGFGQYRVVDDYFRKILDVEVPKLAAEMIHSRYASKIIIDAGAVSDQLDGAMDRIGQLYTAEQVRKGPTAAPEAYREAYITVWMFGPRSEFESMIKELYGEYPGLIQTFGLEPVILIVCDEKDSSIYSMKLYDRGSKLNELIISGDAWYFGEDKQIDISGQKALEDYDYFRNAHGDYMKHTAIEDAARQNN